MYGLLKNKRGIIFGAVDERSIAWHVALACAEEGATFVLTNTEAACKIGNISQLVEAKGWTIIPCDATNVDELQKLFIMSMDILGGPVDFVLHSVAQSVNLRRHRTYENLNYEYFLKTIDISTLSLHKILQTGINMNAISESGSIVTLSYIASERYVEGYGDMGDAKAMLESVVRQLGATYGIKKKIRVNAISQSFIPTSASAQWDTRGHYKRYTESLSPLGNASAQDCADLSVVLFSDLTRKVTMQTIYNDGGLSHTLLTNKLMKMLIDIEKL